MKIVVLTSRFPYPIEKGDKLRMYHQLKCLTKKHEVHLIAISHDLVLQDSVEHLIAMCSSVKVFSTSRFQSGLRAARGLFNKLPFQVNYFYSNRIKRLLTSHINEIEPDVIYCQLIRMSEYVRNLPYPVVLDYMDAFSLNYQRRIKHSSLLTKFFFSGESKRLKHYELDIYKDVDAATIISDSDRSYIDRSVNIAVVSNGIDSKYFTPLEKLKKFDITFVGNMGYHPNIIAAEFLVYKILPLLRKDVTIQIAGARPSRSVKALSSDRVTVTGWLDDIREAYHNARIFVAPIFSGAGQQNKILEAMAMEMVCITTPNVNDAIGAKDGREIMLAGDAQEFAAICEKLLNNQDVCQEIGTNARKFVEANFSWEIENKKLEDILLIAGKENE